MTQEINQNPLHRKVLWPQEFVIFIKQIKPKRAESVQEKEMK